MPVRPYVECSLRHTQRQSSSSLGRISSRLARCFSQSRRLAYLQPACVLGAGIEPRYIPTRERHYDVLYGLISSSTENTTFNGEVNPRRFVECSLLLIRWDRDMNQSSDLSASNLYFLSSSISNSHYILHCMLLVLQYSTYTAILDLSIYQSVFDSNSRSFSTLPTSI